MDFSLGAPWLTYLTHNVSPTLEKNTLPNLAQPLLVPHLFSTVKNQACRPLASSFSPRPAQTRSKVEDKRAKNITNTFYLAFRHGRFFFIALSDARVVSYVLEPSLRVAYVLSVCLLWPTLRCVLLLLSYCVHEKSLIFYSRAPSVHRSCLHSWALTDRRRRACFPFGACCGEW